MMEYKGDTIYMHPRWRNPLGLAYEMIMIIHVDNHVLRRNNQMTQNSNSSYIVQFNIFYVFIIVEITLLQHRLYRALQAIKSDLCWIWQGENEVKITFRIEGVVCFSFYSFPMRIFLPNEIKAFL